jgi:hypothetical protein
VDTAPSVEVVDTGAGVGAPVTHGKPILSPRDLVIPVMVVLISIALYVNVRRQPLDSI